MELRLQVYDAGSWGTLNVRMVGTRDQERDTRNELTALMAKWQVIYPNGTFRIEAR